MNRPGFCVGSINWNPGIPDDFPIIAIKGLKGRQAVNQAITRLQQATGEAVQTLRDIASDEEAKDSARVTAAKVILEMAFKAVELEDLAVRVEELERSAEVRRNA